MVATTSDRSASRGHRFVVLLRAVNVGGHSVMKMADLRAAVESAGMRDVRTYIQSGNVVLSSPIADAKKVERRLRQGLARTLGFAGQLIVLTPTQMRRALRHNPFRPQASHQSLLMFLVSRPKPARTKALLDLQGRDYRFAVKGKVLYWSYPRVLAGKRRTVNMERVLGVAGTSRAAKVVAQLARIADA